MRSMTLRGARSSIMCLRAWSENLSLSWMDSPVDAARVMTRHWLPPLTKRATDWLRSVGGIGS